MKVECPKCKKSFQVKEEFTGRKGRCPACKEVMTILNSQSHSRPCPKCGKPIFGSDVVCTFCGFDTSRVQVSTTVKRPGPNVSCGKGVSSFVPPVSLFEGIGKWTAIVVGVVIIADLLPKVSYRRLYDVGPTDTVIRSFTKFSDMTLAKDAVALINEGMNLAVQGMLHENAKFQVEPPRPGCTHLMIACPYLMTKNIGDTIRALEPYGVAFATGRAGPGSVGEDYMLVVNTPNGSLLASTDQAAVFDSMHVIKVFNEKVYEGFTLNGRTYFGTMGLLGFDVSLKKKGSGARMVEDVFKTVTIIPNNKQEADSVEELKGVIEKFADEMEKIPAASKGPTPFISSGTFKKLITERYQGCPYGLMGPQVVEDKVLEDQLITEDEEGVVISGNGRLVGPSDLLVAAKVFPEGRKFYAIQISTPRIRQEEKSQATLILKNLPLHQTYVLTREGKAAGKFSLPMTRLDKKMWWLSLISFTVFSLVCCGGTVKAGNYINNGQEHLAPKMIWTLTGVCGGLLVGMALSIALAMSVVEAGSITIGDSLGSFLVNAAAGFVIFVLLMVTTFIYGAER
jgi:hypothetical protein